MSPDLDCPYLEYEDIRKEADAFLIEHHPSGTIPVPIEEIVEFELGWDIVPIQGLRRLLDVEGFLSGDRETLWVDEDIWRTFPARYRFTIAHEVGHFIFHPQAFENRPD
ncbi:MAG: ImmA/IrrE family metallo-endopeptidase, partial [Candidatus Tectimicrobiota bacterium]